MGAMPPGGSGYDGHARSKGSVLGFAFAQDCQAEGLSKITIILNKKMTPGTCQRQRTHRGLPLKDRSTYGFTQVETYSLDLA